MPRVLRIAICLAAGSLAAGLVAFRSNHEVSQVVPPRTPTHHKPALKPAPSTPIAELKAKLGDDETWRPEWDALIEEALPPAMLSPQMSRNVKPFCPKFNMMGEGDKRAFWAYFFQALSGAEAGLSPTSDVQHSEPEVAVVDSVSHQMVRSQGLLQLTYEDAARYGCDFDWRRDKNLSAGDPKKTILQPRNNLLCGVRILEKQLITKKRPLLSKASYWSVLRPDWPGYHVFVEQMRNAPSGCGVPQVPATTEQDRIASSERASR